jgi:hypothetical protein
MRYIEDILSDIVENYASGSLIEAKDLLILESFNNIQNRGDHLTKNQGSLLLKILTKYQPVFKFHGVDYAEDLENPSWKSSFRMLDLSRKLYIEEQDQTPYIFLKFPYQLKEQFEKEVSTPGHWDHNTRARKINLYDANIIQISEFALKNNFDIDENFRQSLADVEEILSQQEKIVPACEIIDSQVMLTNGSEETQQWWDYNKFNNIPDDLLLAKSMGYKFSGKTTNEIEKISSTDETNFWMKSPGNFLRFVKNLSGKFVLVMDRAHDNKKWLEGFTDCAERTGFSSRDIKVCFRADKNDDPEFNEWIKEKGYGGKVEEGKILIFNHKPAKWIFKNPEQIRVIATNNLYPPTDSITKDWMSSHCCVIYLGDIKPSKSKDRNIVEL